METSDTISLMSSGNQAKIKQLSCLSLLTEWKILLRDPSHLKEYRQEPDGPAGLAAQQLSEGAVSVSRRAL